MGHRSWLTPVYSELDYKKVIDWVEKYSSYGVSYVIQINKEGKIPFKNGDVLIAWSGGGSWEINGLKPSYCRKNTILLDNFLDDFPSWHSGKKGPGKYGNLLKNKNESPDWSLITIDEDLTETDEFWFEDFQFNIEIKSVYSIPTSHLDQNDNFIFYLEDSEGVIFKIKVDWNSKFPLIYKKELNGNKFNQFQVDNGKSILLTDKLELKFLLEFLSENPKRSFIDYLKTNKLIE